MYTYYVKVHSEEHMLYLKEIAEAYGLYSMNKGTPHSRLVTAIMDEYAFIQKKQYPEIYWGANCFMRVWPREQYHPAMTWFKDMIKRTQATQYTFHDGKSYNFIVRDDPELEQRMSDVIGD